MTQATNALQKAQAFIMAGGRGQRLHPLTASRPKPAIPFGGVFRIIDFALSNCLNSSLSRVSLLTQYMHEELQSYIRQSWSGHWSRTKKEPLVCVPPQNGKSYRGTADAVFQNISMLQADKPDTVLILSSDHVYHMDYGGLLRAHTETEADLTIATVEHSLKDATHFGVVDVDAKQRVVGFQEKPPFPRPMRSRPAAALINMGVYAFRREVLIQALIESCDKAERYDFGHHVIPSLIHSARTYAYDFRDEASASPRYWRDIGTLDSYYETSMDLVAPKAPFDPYLNDDRTSHPARQQTLNDQGSSSAYSRARGRANYDVFRSVLAPGVHIEDGGWVERSVLMSGVSIGRGARIRRAIIEEGVRIPAGSHIGYDPELDRKNYTVTDAGVVVVSSMPQTN